MICCNVIFVPRRVELNKFVIECSTYALSWTVMDESLGIGRFVALFHFQY